MLMRGLNTAPEVEVRNENDRHLFHRFRMRSDDVLRETVTRSRHAFVLVKPLCDSQRIDELLDLSGMAPGRAVWVFRDVDDRARSEVSKFGDSNLLALRRIADGTSATDWQAQRLSEPLRELVSGFDCQQMTPDSAAALFWYVRNSLYFDLGLDRREDVLLASYDELVADPEGSMRRLCEFISFPYRTELIDHVERRTSLDDLRMMRAAEVPNDDGFHAQADLRGGVPTIGNHDAQAHPGLPLADQLWS